MQKNHWVEPEIFNSQLLALTWPVIVKTVIWPLYRNWLSFNSPDQCFIVFMAALIGEIIFQSIGREFLHSKEL